MHHTQRLGLLVALLLAAVASACGNTVVNNDGGGGCADTGHCLPACPDPLPEGGPCPVVGQVCGELDACGAGRQAVCSADGWVLNWHDECGCDLPCPTPTCPADQPADGSACSEEGAACHYTSPSCNEAWADASCTNGAWSVSESGPGCLLTCPATLPLPGTACDGCCLAGDCSYLDASGCPSHVACQDGVWITTAELCTPASACGALSMGACSNAQGCRWMAHPGCPSTWQNFPQGCYPVADCTSDADCNGGTCQAVEVDPCPAGDCGACSAAAKICVP